MINSEKDFFKRNTIIFLVCVIFIGTIYFFIMNKNNSYYNPIKESKFLNIENTENSEFGYLLKTYLKLQISGLQMLTNELASNHNQYEMDAVIQDISHMKYFYTTSPNIKFIVEKSQLKFVELDESYILSRDFNEFIIPDNTTPILDITQNDLYKKIKDSNYEWDVSISFSDYVSFEKIANFMNECENAKFVWLAIDHIDKGYTYSIGLSLLEDEFNVSLTGNAEKEYPYLSLSNTRKYDYNDLKQSYISKIKLLRDHSDFLNLMPKANIPNGIQPDVIDDLYNYAIQNDFCYGIRLITNSQNILSLIEMFGANAIYIHN